MRLAALLSLFAAMLLLTCSPRAAKSEYESLLEYSGDYEYGNPAVVTLAASNFDTTLYAILDEAKYPLEHVRADTFQNRSKTPVVFLRDAKGKVSGYTTEGRIFQRLTDNTPRQEWFPRKALYAKVDDYQYEMPVTLSDGLVTGDVRDAFSHPERLFEMVRKTVAGEFPDVHSILIWKDGKLVMEEYFYDYDIDRPHQLRSASKSFIGALVGIAVDQGKIKDENEKLLTFFDKIYPSIRNRDQRKEKISVKDFLTYRHGMDCNDDDQNTAGNELKMYPKKDWIKFALDLPMVEEPGVRSSYCTACAQTLGRLVEIATGTPLTQFAAANLFGPMGITNYKWRFQPDSSSAGTFNQMYLRPRDMMKLALMYNNQGVWNGKQVLSSAWVKKTFEKEDAEFGFLWRHKWYDVDGKSYNSFLATGNGGQKINIWPELNMITVFTGGNYNSFLYGKPTPPNEMIPAFILKSI